MPLARVAWWMGKTLVKTVACALSCISCQKPPSHAAHYKSLADRVSAAWSWKIDDLFSLFLSTQERANLKEGRAACMSDHKMFFGLGHGNSLPGTTPEAFALSPTDDRSLKAEAWSRSAMMISELARIGPTFTKGVDLFIACSIIEDTKHLALGRVTVRDFLTACEATPYSLIQYNQWQHPPVIPAGMQGHITPLAMNWGLHHDLDKTIHYKDELNALSSLCLFNIRASLLHTLRIHTAILAAEQKE